MGGGVLEGGSCTLDRFKERLLFGNSEVLGIWLRRVGGWKLGYGGLMER